MKLLAINGSPRKGNIYFMLQTIVAAAKKNGADVEVIELRGKKIYFCDGGDDCCPKTLKCHIKDEMLDIYPKLEEADMILLASPTYFSNVSARMKNFMDRCNPYWFNKKLKGKKAFLLGVGGNKKSVKEMLKIMESFIRLLEIEHIGSYHAVADKIGDIKENIKVIKELNELGAKLN